MGVFLALRSPFGSAATASANLTLGAGTPLAALHRSATAALTESSLRTDLSFGAPGHAFATALPFATTMIHALTVLADLAFLALIVVEAAPLTAHVAATFLITGQSLRTVSVLAAVQHLLRTTHVHRADLALGAVGVILTAIGPLTHALHALSTIVAVVILTAALTWRRTCVLVPTWSPVLGAGACVLNDRSPILGGLTGILGDLTGVLGHTAVCASARILLADASILSRGEPRIGFWVRARWLNAWTSDEQTSNEAKLNTHDGFSPACEIIACRGRAKTPVMQTPIFSTP